MSSLGAMDSKLAPVKINAQRRVIPEGDKQRVAYWRVTLGRRITRGEQDPPFLQELRGRQEICRGQPGQ